MKDINLVVNSNGSQLLTSFVKCRKMTGLLRVLWVLLVIVLIKCESIKAVDLSRTGRQTLDESALPEGYTIFPNHKVAYKIYTEALPWDAARGKCKSDGGDLAIAGSSDKIQYIRNMDLLKKFYLLIGDYKPTGSARWKTVEEVGFLTKYEDCGAIALADNSKTTVPCSESRPFVCEIWIREHQGVAENTTSTTPSTTSLTSTLPPSPTPPLPPPPSLRLPTIAIISDNFSLQSVEIPRLGILYKFHGDRLTHHEARRRCFADGGRLAVVDSFEKINVISTILDEEPVHVGIRVSSENFEEWVGDSDGKSLKDLPWIADNPHPAKCAALRKDESGLEDTLCSNKLQFLCEVVRNNN